LRQKFTMRIDNSGFTLIEILVTITIIALVSTIGVTGYQAVSRGGRDALRKTDLEQIRSALEIYKSENNSYPSVDNCIPAELSLDYINPYPQDPKTPAFQYCYKSTSPLTYELCTHLENEDQNDNYCGNESACGSGCNYAVVNP